MQPLQNSLIYGAAPCIRCDKDVQLLICIYNIQSAQAVTQRRVNVKAARKVLKQNRLRSQS
jgi:hypothetical protein